MTHKVLDPFKDIVMVRKMEALREEVVEDSVYLSVAWLKKRGYTAVPLVSASHFDREYAATISAALVKLGIKECYALPTEPLPDDMRCYIAKSTVEGLLTFNWTCSLYNYVLLPEEGGVVILCTTDDYFIVAGPAEFVGGICGEISSAREKFKDYAQGNDRLLKMAERYEVL